MKVNNPIIFAPRIVKNITGFLNLLSDSIFNNRYLTNFLNSEKINNRMKPPPSNSISWAVFTAPAFLMLLVLIFIITMTSHYYIRINKGDVSKDYYKYSSLATFSICCQYLLLVYYILTENKTIVNDNKYPLVFLNYLFTICNLLIIIMLSIVANYFITDG